MKQLYFGAGFGAISMALVIYGGFWPAVIFMVAIGVVGSLSNDFNLDL